MDNSKMSEDAARFMNGSAGILYALKNEVDNKVKTCLQRYMDSDSPLSAEDLLVMQAMLQEAVTTMQEQQQRIDALEQRIAMLEQHSSDAI